jgi:hypothetical protein
MAARNAGLIEDDKEIVTNALSYLKTDTARLWKQLPGGHQPYDFAQWRREVMRILPKGSRYDVGSMSRLDALCRKVRDRPIGRDEKSAFYEFILAFKADAGPLLEAGLIANRDMVVKFISGLKATFREALSERLNRMIEQEGEEENELVRDEEDPFDLKEVIDTAKEMVDAASVGPFGSLVAIAEEADYARGASLGGLSNRAESAGLKEVKVKQESMEQDMAKAFTTLANVEKTMAKLSTQFDTFSTTVRAAPQGNPYRSQGQAPPSQRPGMYPRPPGATFNCWYCGEGSHTISACPEVRQGIENGRITRQGSSLFCKGNILQRESPDGTTMKARVDAMWKTPTTMELKMLEEYNNLEAEAYDVFTVGAEEPVSYSTFQQSMERLHRDQNQFLSHIAQQLQPARAAAPKVEVSQEPSLKDLFEQIAKLTTKVEGVEQFQLQTRRAAADKEKGF